MRTLKEELNTPVVLTVGAVAAILLFVAVLLLQAWFARAQQAEHVRKVVAPAAEELAQVQAAQDAQLADYRWLDRGRGVVAIPIERAMELVGSELPARPAAAPAAPPAARPAPPPAHGAAHNAPRH